MDVAKLRRLAFVPRWTIVPTVRSQSVAEHSFAVVWIVFQLCDKLCIPPERRVRLLAMALDHDEDEAKTGDCPTPSKPLRPLKDLDEDALIVKVADCLEAVMFLNEEMLLGNKAIDAVWVDVAHRLHGYILELENRFGLTRLDEIPFNNPHQEPETLDEWAAKLLASCSLKDHPGMKP